MSEEKAIRALYAVKCLSDIMDLCDEYDEEEPKVKKRKTYVKSEDIESQVLKGIAWNNADSEDSFCPMTMENFEDLHYIVSSNIDRRTLVLPFIPLRMRLAITLRYLIAGDSHRLLESVSHVSRKHTMRFIPQMLKHLIEILENNYLKLPKTEIEWKNVSRNFETFWDFPHTLGVLDATNFRVKSPSINKKSLILLGTLDAHGRFQHIEIIESEDCEYSSSYINSRLYKSLKRNTLNIPSGDTLKGQSDKTPYYFVANEIFSLDRNTLVPYDKTSKMTRSQKAFNSRINRSILPSRMAFEIIFFRFKIFQRLLEIDIDKAKLVINVCCLLHNYLTRKLTEPLEYNDDLTALELPGSAKNLPKQISESYENVSNTRENVCNYCVNEGNIPE